ncbi:hypothetical protein MRX96_016962 [Rhipicephalus microplus]
MVRGGSNSFGCLRTRYEYDFILTRLQCLYEIVLDLSETRFSDWQVDCVVFLRGLDEDLSCDARCECGQSVSGKLPRVPYRRATQFGGRLSQTPRSSTATEFRSESFPTAPHPITYRGSERSRLGGPYATSCDWRCRPRAEDSLCKRAAGPVARLF